jgi:hypothetical protein
MAASKIVIEKTIEAKPGSSFVLGSGFTILPPTSKDGVPLIVSYKNEPIKKEDAKPHKRSRLKKTRISPVF